MAVSSMTGFARAEGCHGALRWTWEVKSVNGRSLDLRCRLPQRMDWLEPIVREAAGRRFKRGHVGVALNLDQTETPARMRLNRELLDQLLAVAGEAAERSAAAPPRIEGLMAIRGVVEIADPEEDEAGREAREAALVASLEEALDALATARRTEGGRLDAILREQMDKVAALAARAAALPALAPEAVKVRLAEKLAPLLEKIPAMPEERLAQEAALIAVKADIREEVDRLHAHVTAARDLLDADDAVGRRLDFLSQEFNREANTLCSKSTDLELTRIGLDLKAVIDQFREQAQNVE